MVVLVVHGRQCITRRTTPVVDLVLVVPQRNRWYLKREVVVVLQDILELAEVVLRVVLVLL